MLNRMIFIAVLLTMLEPACAQPPVLTIDEAVRLAISRNPTVVAAMERMEAARARAQAARADRLPQVDAAVEYRRVTSLPTFMVPSPDPEIPPIEITAGERETTLGILTARQAIYTGGRVSGSITRAEALFDVSVANLVVTEDQIVLLAREAYYGALLAQNLVLSAERSLTAAQQQLDVSTARYEVGTAPLFDVLRAQTQVSEGQQTLTEAQNNLQIAQVALNRIIGAPLDQECVLVEPGLAPLPESGVQELLEAARERRPELLAAQAQVEAAEAGIDIAEAQLKPQLGVSAVYQAVGDESPLQTSGWTFVVSAGVEVFDGGRRRANISEARSLTQEARANLEDTEVSVEQEVREAYLNLQTTRQTIETAQARLAQAEEAYEIATVRYEAGVATAAEIADALAALTAAQTNVNRAIYNYNVALARLRRSVGGNGLISPGQQSN